MTNYDFLDFDRCMALDIDEFMDDDWVNNHKDELSIFNINIRSIKNKFSELLSLIKILPAQFTFIVVTETMLTEILDFNFEIEGLKSTSIYRTSSGGGIKIYWRDNLNVSKIEGLSGLFPSHEALFLQAKLQGMATVTLGAIYRPPSLSIDLFNEYIVSHIMPKQFKNLTLVGDFNINILKANSERNINDFIGMMNSYGLYNYINKPTYFSPVQGQITSVLDHIWHNIGKPCKSYVLSPPLSDHLPCCIIFENKISSKMYHIKFRDFSNCNRVKFIEHLEQEFSIFDQSLNDANTTTNKVVDWLMSLSDKYFPIKLKIISHKRAEAPWLSSRLIKCIRKKHWLFKLLKRNIITYNMYKAYASLLRFTLNIAERNYHKMKFKSCKNNSRKTWKHLNLLLGRSLSGSSEEFIIDGNVTQNNMQIAKSFAQYFDEIPRITQNSVGLCNLDLLSLVPINNGSLFLNPTNVKEIRSIIGSLKNSNDLADIPVLLIKIGMDYISNIISNLYNLCILEGTYPNLFKIARIIPIFKKDEKNLIQNYRPVSILPVLNKIFEKLTLNRLNSFINVNNLISNSQHGFRSGFGTDSAMLDLMRHVLPAFATKKYAACVFIDFSKAFDTVDHAVLLNKLERYGVRGVCLDFFRSYLNNRHMFVNYNNENSDRYSLHSSVPQGSCLGPVLYNMYTNDLNYYINDTPTVIYADDTIFIVVSEDFDFMIDFLNEKMKKLIEWCKFNRLCLNPDKTKFMIMSPLSIPYEPSLKVNSITVERVHCFKYLGVFFDDKLKFHEQTNSLNSKLSRLCGITYRLAQFYTFDVAKTFYYSFVYPVISYGLAVWGGCLVHTGRYIRTQNYQNRIIKNLFAKYFEGHSINYIYKQLKIIKINDLYNLKCAEFMFKIMILGCFPDFKLFLMMACIQPSHQTRHCNQLRPTFPRIDVIKLSYWYQFIIVWNDIPDQIKDSVNIAQFKSKFISHILGSY
jgi:hypothetical protein